MSRAMTHLDAIGCVAVAGLLVAGCVRPARQPTAAVPTIAGRWRSTSGTGDLDVTLWVKGTHVGGSGWLTRSDRPSMQLAVTGQFAPPAFVLQLMVRDRMTAEYVGRLDSTGTMRGVLRAPGGPATDSLILSRLPSRP